jgi:import inner membrane translocase subunit TIM50
VQGSRPKEEVIRQATEAKETPAQEPVAQKKDIDEPVEGSARATAQDGLAASENTVAPENASEPQTPLPDLRQGLPSTFDFEFGSKKSQGKSEGKDDFDVANLPEEVVRGREKGDREYDASAYETSTDRRRNAMAQYGFAAALIAAIGSALYMARPFPEDGTTATNPGEAAPKGFDASNARSWSPGSMYARIRARMGNSMGYYTEPAFTKLLPDIPPGNQAPPYTLVLSLEDLMVHTTWDTKNGYRLAKRPGLDYFIRYLSQYYELVLFTTSPRYMADSVMAKLDPFHFIMWPLGREATRYENGEYVKDLEYLNRPLSKTIIVDTRAAHVKNQPENAIVLPGWKGTADSSAADLVALIPFLEYIATMGTEDVRTVLKSFEGTNIPEEFARREAIARAKFMEQNSSQRSKKPKFSVGSLAGSLGVTSKGMGGGMVLGDGQSVAEGLAQGKMLIDQIREQGQKQYEALEKQIREHGEQWLKEEKEEQQRLMDQSMKEMKQGALGWFGGSKKEPTAEESK